MYKIENNLFYNVCYENQAEDILSVSDHVLLLQGLPKVAGECSKVDYQYCVRLADPLLKDPQLIYPDKQDDIEHVCRYVLFV